MPVAFFQSLVVAMLLFVSASAVAQDQQPVEFRWKLNEGDRFQTVYELSSQINSQVTKRKTGLSSSTKISATWTIKESTDDGAMVEQTIDAIALLVENATDQTKSIAIDTASDDRVPRNAKALSKQVHPVVGATLTFRLSSRGVISDVQIPDDTSAKLAAVNELLTVAPPIGAMIGLPDSAIAVGGDWTAISGKSPMTLTYVGRRELNGRTQDFFKSPQADDAGRSVEFYFDRDAGHVTEFRSEVTNTNARDYRDMKMQSYITLRSHFRFSKHQDR